MENEASIAIEGFLRGIVNKLGKIVGSISGSLKSFILKLKKVSTRETKAEEGFFTKSKPKSFSFDAMDYVIAHASELQTKANGKTDFVVTSSDEAVDSFIRTVTQLFKTEILWKSGTGFMLIAFKNKDGSSSDKPMYGALTDAVGSTIVLANGIVIVKSKQPIDKIIVDKGNGEWSYTDECIGTVVGFEFFLFIISDCENPTPGSMSMMLPLGNMSITPHK